MKNDDVCVCAGTADRHGTVVGVTTSSQTIAKPNVSGSFSQKLRKELVDLYMQGWLDRDWKVGEDEADNKAEMYADGIMNKYKL